MIYNMNQISNLFGPMSLLYRIPPSSQDTIPIMDRNDQIAKVSLMPPNTNDFLKLFLVLNLYYRAYVAINGLRISNKSLAAKIMV